MLKILIKNKLKIITLGYTRDEPKKKAGRIIGTLIGAAIFSVLLFYSAKLISIIYGRLDIELANIIFDIGFDYIFAVIFIFVIFTGVATSLYVLYLSRDLELLLSLPLGYRTVFTYKYIEALITNSYLFFIAILPVLIAYGFTSEMSIAYYPVMIIVFISVLSIPTSLGVLAGMIAARYINPGKAREILAVIGGLLGLIIWLLSQIISRYAKNISPELKSMGVEDIKQYVIAIFDKPFLKAFPSTWGSNALFYLHNGNYGGFINNFILVMVTSIVLIFICIAISQRIYYSGWSSTSQVNVRKRRKKEKTEEAEGDYKKRSYSFFTGINYLIFKDFKVIFRDARKLLNIFMPLVMFTFIFFWTISRSVNENSGINFFIPVKIILFLFFPLAVSGIINANLSGNNIGGEGLKFWILKTCPVDMKRILKTKIIFSSALTALCGCLIMVIFYVMYRPGLPYLLLGIVLMILFSWGDSIISTSVGSFFPVFKPSASKKNNISFLGSILNLIVFLVYLLFFAGIAIGMLFLANYLSWPYYLIFPVIMVLELILDIILYNILVNISAYKLNRIEWKF